MIGSKVSKKLSKRPPEILPEDHPTDWKTVYVVIALSILGALQESLLGPLIWPYLQRLVPTSTQAMYASMVSLKNLFSAIMSVLAGYLSNYFAHTKGALIFDKITDISACLLFFSLEVSTPIRVIIFFALHVLFGLGSGCSSVGKTQIVMSTREFDLPRVMGMIGCAGVVGMVLRPVFQVFIQKLGYPGIPLFFGIRLNLYTLPVVISLCLAFTCLMLIVFCFDGKMKIRRKDGGLEAKKSDQEEAKKMLEPKETNKTPKKPKIPYDIVAVVICIFTNICLGIGISVLMTIMGPHSMMVFQWTSEDAVWWGAIGMLMIGFFMISTLVSYVFLNLGQRISPRNGIIFSLALIFLFYFITYPWSFYGESIPYKHLRGTDPSNFTLTNAYRNDTSLDLVGCPLEYKWCESTPPMNFVSYMIVSSIALGIAMPMFHINLNVLYSQILGPIKQGTLQGIYNALGIVVNTVAPLGLSKVYANSGVINIWLFIMATLILTIILWVVFYKRMISYKIRVEQMEKETGVT